MLNTLRTADLALATYLKMEGYPSDRLEITSAGPRPVAEFVITCEQGRDGSLRALCSDYERGAARIEPRSFALEYRKVRDRLFAFLKDHREPDQRPRPGRGKSSSWWDSEDEDG